jgi:hypothetical protein
MEVKQIKELDDGCAELVVDLNEEEVNYLVNLGLVTLLRTVIKNKTFLCNSDYELPDLNTKLTD